MLLSRSSSSVSNIIEEMIKDRKINITEENSNEPINGEIREQKDPEINNKDPKIGKDQNLSKIPKIGNCLLYTSPSPRDGLLSRMPSSA